MSNEKSKQRDRRLDLYNNWKEAFYAFAEKEATHPSDEQIDPVGVSVLAVSFCADVVAQCAKCDSADLDGFISAYTGNFSEALRGRMQASF